MLAERIESFSNAASQEVPLYLWRGTRGHEVSPVTITRMNQRNLLKGRRRVDDKLSRSTLRPPQL